MTDMKLQDALRDRLQRCSTTAERKAALAEMTDLSPNQAEEMLAKHASDLDHLAREAVAFKAES